MVVGLRSNVVMVVALRVRAVPSAACAPTLRDSMIPHIDCTQLASQQVVYHSQPHKVAHGRVMSATLLGRALSFSRTVTAANPTTVAGGQALIGYLRLTIALSYRLNWLPLPP